MMSVKLTMLVATMMGDAAMVHIVNSVLRGGRVDRDVRGGHAAHPTHSAHAHMYSVSV